MVFHVAWWVVVGKNFVHGLRSSENISFMVFVHGWVREGCLAMNEFFSQPRGFLGVLRAFWHGFGTPILTVCRRKNVNFCHQTMTIKKYMEPNTLCILPVLGLGMTMFGSIYFIFIGE
jgi:hypothetical protein